MHKNVCWVSLLYNYTNLIVISLSIDSRVLGLGGSTGCGTLTGWPLASFLSYNTLRLSSTPKCLCICSSDTIGLRFSSTILSSTLSGTAGGIDGKFSFKSKFGIEWRYCGFGFGLFKVGFSGEEGIEDMSWTDFWIILVWSRRRFSLCRRNSSCSSWRSSLSKRRTSYFGNWRVNYWVCKLKRASKVLIVIKNPKVKITPYQVIINVQF